MLCSVDYIFNLLCAFNFLQPMKNFIFSLASRATGRLQIKPSGSGDENEQGAKRTKTMPSEMGIPTLTSDVFLNQKPSKQTSHE